MHLTISIEHAATLSRIYLIFVLFSSNPFVLEQLAIHSGKLFEDGRLFVTGLQKPNLKWSELLQLHLEKLVFLVAHSLLGVNQDV